MSLPPRALVASWALAALLLPALAQGERSVAPRPPLPTNLPPVEDPHTVAVLPVLDLTGEREELAARAEHLMALHLEREPRLTVISGAQLVERLKADPDYRRDLRFAREFSRLGQRDYERIRLKDAIRNLREATALFEKLHQDVIEPQEVMTAYLTLGKAFLEEGDGTQAGLAFRRLLALNPALRLSRKEYSESVVKAFDAARFQFMNGPTSGRTMERALALGEQVHADYVVSGHVRPRSTAGTASLGVWLYNVRRELPQVREEKVPADASEGFADQMDRLASRLAACIPNDTYLAAARDPDRYRSQLFIDTSFLMARYVEHPLQRGFPNLGFSAGLSWAPLRQLMVQGRLGFTSAQNNPPYDDLLELGRILRLLLAAGIAHNGRSFNVFSSLGVDLTLPMGFRWTREADCKWHEPQPSTCEDDAYEPGLVFGLHAGLGGHWVVAPPLFLRARLGITYNLLPTIGVELDLPVDGELGVGYRF